VYKLSEVISCYLQQRLDKIIQDNWLPMWKNTDRR